MFALQRSGCYVIMPEEVSQNTLACAQRRRWCFYDDDHQSMEKLNSARFSPQKMLCLLNKLITLLQQEIPLVQKCEAEDDPRALGIFKISHIPATKCPEEKDKGVEFV